jgi:hypothetical protein
MSNTVDQQLQAMIGNMPEKTGKSLEAWYQVIISAKVDKHGDIMKLLKEKYGVTHGYANTISALYRQQASGGPALQDTLIDGQYTGAKSDLRPIYDAILSAVSRFGSDIEIAPKKTYVSLRRHKQFAIVKAATKSRVDLGLNLKGVAPTDRLEGSNVFSGMCSHLVRLTSPSDVDTEVTSWLEEAYNQS